MAGFKPARPDQISENVHYALLADSITFAIGQAIAGVAGTFGTVTNASLNGSNAVILGVITGFTDAYGQVLGNGDKTSLASGSAQGFYAQYIPANSQNEFYAPLSAASGTTTGSDKPLVYFDLASTADQLNEASVQHWGTIRQFLSLGVDPNNSSQVVGFFVQNVWGQYDGVAS